MKDNSRNHILLPFFLALLIMTSFIVPATSIESYAYTGTSAEEDEAVPDAPWYDSIPDLLAAGEYEEGVVIAGIDMSRAKAPADPGSALDACKLSAGTEELICVDPEDAYTQQDFVSWLQQLKDGLSAEYDDRICITSIRRSDMTTARILELLATDDSIVFAEPNYIVSMDSLEIGQNTDSPTPNPDAAAVEDSAGFSTSAEIASPNATTAPNAPDATDAPDATTAPDATSAPASPAAITADTPITETSKAAAGEFINGETDPSLAAIQWSSSPDATFRALGATDNYSINVPGWPDDSNMDHEITVAVLDCAVDFSNPDLRDRAYTFSPELMGRLCTDQ